MMAEIEAETEQPEDEIVQLEAGRRGEIAQWESDMKDLEDRETKLIEEFKKVVSSLYVLLVYVLAMVLGLLSSDLCDPHRLANVVAIVCFLTAMGFAIYFAYRQLKCLRAKTPDLIDERARLRTTYVEHMSSYIVVLQTMNHVLLQKMSNYKPKNFFYTRFLLIIIICGFLSAIIILVAAYHVLWDSKSMKLFSCTPCAPHTPRCLHSAVSLEPVADHVPFSPCVPSLRPCADM